MCSNSTANAAAMVGNSAITAGNNFNASADSGLGAELQTGADGQRPERPAVPLRLEVALVLPRFGNLNATTGVWGSSSKTGTTLRPVGRRCGGLPDLPGERLLLPNALDSSAPELGNANTGTPDNPNAASPAPNQLFIGFNDGVPGLATPTTYFAYGHEHADLKIFGGSRRLRPARHRLSTTTTSSPTSTTAAQGAACSAASQAGHPRSISSATAAVRRNRHAERGRRERGGWSWSPSAAPELGTSRSFPSLVSAPLYAGPLTSRPSRASANNGVLFGPERDAHGELFDSRRWRSRRRTPGSRIRRQRRLRDEHPVHGQRGQRRSPRQQRMRDHGRHHPEQPRDAADQCEGHDRLELTQRRSHPRRSRPVRHGERGVERDEPRERPVHVPVREARQCTASANPPTAKFTVLITADGLTARRCSRRSR